MQGVFNVRSSEARCLQCKELSSKESRVYLKRSQSKRLQCKELSSKESLLEGALKQGVFSVLKALSRFSVQGPIKKEVFSARSSQARSLQFT